MAEDVEDFIHVHGLDTPVVIGHSMFVSCGCEKAWYPIDMCPKGSQGCHDHGLAVSRSIKSFGLR